jgi:hypothetical protein
VGAVFLVGCAVGGVSGQMTLPKASAQQATLPQSEYFCTDTGTLHGSVTERASRLAAERWELAGVVNASLWCWKRPKM